MNRREFLRITAAAAGIAVVGWPHPLAAEIPAKPIGIQVGAVSFLDEGTDKVLDTLAEAGAIDTLFLATFTYGRGIGGRQLPGQPLPDHGKQEYERQLSRRQFRDAASAVLQRHRICRRRRPIIRTTMSSPTCCRARTRAA